MGFEFFLTVSFGHGQWNCFWMPSPLVRNFAAVFNCFTYKLHAEWFQLCFKASGPFALLVAIHNFTVHLILASSYEYHIQLFTRTIHQTNSVPFDTFSCIDISLT